MDTHDFTQPNLARNSGTLTHFFVLLNLSIYEDKNLFKAGTHYYSVGEGKQRGKHI